MALCVVCLLLPLAQSAGGESLSGTTGLPAEKPDRPALAVIHNTTESRPQWGLSQADIIYELIYWGPQHTRYIAVFNDAYPERIGPIRGARTYDVDMLLAWDGVLIHFGGQDASGTSIYDAMKEHRITSGVQSFDGARGGSYFIMDPTRINPHNGVFHLAEMMEESWPSEDGTPHVPHPSGLSFSASPSHGDAEITSISVAYGQTDYLASFAYDPEAGYVRHYNGEPMTDLTDGAPIIVSNVIVAAHPLSFYEGKESRPVVALTGEGPIAAYIDGTRIAGRWQRDAATDPIRYFDEGGNPLLLRPGKTFVQIVTPEMFDGEKVQGDAVRYTNGMDI